MLRTRGMRCSTSNITGGVEVLEAFVVVVVSGVFLFLRVLARAEALARVVLPVKKFVVVWETTLRSG